MSQQLWAIRRKTDGAFFPINSRSRANSFIEFPDLNQPARLPPRTFVTIGAAKGTLTNWLKGPLYALPRNNVGNYSDFDYEDIARYEYKHDSARGTVTDYEIVAVSITQI